MAIRYRWFAAACLLLAASSAGAQTPRACADLTAPNLVEHTRITTATPTAASTAPPLPAHCDVVGRIDERMGRDGKPYAIGFHLRLPEQWNGRFFVQGGGGADGVLGNALGPTGPGQSTTALSQGYAVVSTDAGHTAEPGSPVGSVLFGVDPQARLDYGYNAIDVVTRTAKTIVALHYGRPPSFSYFVGCSNGGRQGLVAATRFPDHFDGIVAGDPGFNLPRAAVAEAWDSQAFAAAATERDAAGQPYLPTSLTDADLTLVAHHILDRCDALDGLRDGIVERTRACTVDLASLSCNATGLLRQDKACLSSEQVTALTRVFGGARTKSGKPIYADWPWDPGIAGAGWRVWKLGMPNPGRANSAINMTLGAGALPYVFTTPPETVAAADIAHYMLTVDVDRAASAIARRDDTYRAAATEFMTAKPDRLNAFRRSHGKLLVYHGAADPVFSVNDTLDAFGPAAESHPDSVRIFVVPGMNHCGGGPATDQFDALAPLVRWVEQGVAPDEIVGTANPSSPWPGRTRPLCAYPQEARYVGSGDIDRAGSFVCSSVRP
jgi:feruloyl esterase